MAAIVILFFFLGFTPSWTVLLFPIPLIYTFVFCVGLGMLLCTVNIFFRDTGHLYSVWVVAWMYLTPIIYPVEILPDAVLKVVRLNPLYYYVEYFRMLVLYGELPGLWLNLICIFFSVTMFLIGLTVFKLKQDKFILHI
jgi:ABC-2 type transport system permease protein